MIIIVAISLVVAAIIIGLILYTIMRGLKRVGVKLYDIVHNEGDLTRKKPCFY